MTANSEHAIIRDMPARQFSISGWLRSAGRLAFETFTSFQRNQCSLLAAGLAYYGLISVSPLLVVAIGVVGLILGREEAQQALFDRINELFVPQAAETVSGLVRDVSILSGGLTASLIAVGVLLYGSSRVFTALQSSLDVIWEVPQSTSVRRGIVQFVRSRLLAFALVLGMGLIMLATMMIETLGVTLEATMERYTSIDPELGSFGNRLAVVVVRALGLAFVYHSLPSREVAWRDALPAGLLAATLLTAGHTLLGLYFGYSGVRSAYGAAGSVIVLLFSFYYGAFVVLLSAQFTRVYSQRRNDSEHARLLDEEAE